MKIKHYCIDCKVNKICYWTWKYGGQRCVDCAIKVIKHKLNCQCGVCKAKRGEYKGSKNPMFGKKRPEFSKKIQGKNNPFYGKRHTKETKQKISNTSKGKNNPNYKDGRSNLPYPLEFDNVLKESIRKRDHYQCQNCSMTEEEHLIILGHALHIHHIDYNKMNCSENNLITLCNQCNVRANYNREYWIGFYKNKSVNLIKI